jgi:serine kinase of HPr protein (carbohydrate metabolism regulator)
MVRISHRRAGSITVRREPPEAVFVVPQPVSAAAIVHPAGTLPLSVLAHWRGDVTLHGGAFVRAGGAWGVCGGQNAGKSTTLALLAARGIPIVADDLLVIQRGEALAGPRCVDLRGDAADRFPAARSLGMVGARVRYRLPTTAAPARTPLRGIIVLEWSADGVTELTPLDLEERLALLHEHQYSGLFSRPPGRGIIELLDLPMLRFRRPPDWSRGDEAIERVLDAADAH